MTVRSIPRVVFDTNTVISAIVFTGSGLAWLRGHWRDGSSILLASNATVAELKRVLTYSKFRLTAETQLELLADYYPYCTTIEPAEPCPIRCRDPKDQALLDLAYCGRADILVTGDQDLLVLSGHTRFAIEMPEAYRNRFYRAE